MLDRDHLGLLDVTVRRNAFGRQLASFEAELDWEGEPLQAIFIRAPWVEDAGDGVEVLAEVEGHPVAVRQGNILAVAFHPELTDERRLHRWLLEHAKVTTSMRDHRADALAQILVRYSTQVSKGDVCVIQSTTAAEPLVQAIYEEVLRAGGLPVMQLTSEGAKSAFFELAGPEQLDWIAPPPPGRPRTPTFRSAMMADVNARELSKIDPKKQARAQKARKALMETSMKRSAEGEYRWSLTLFPTHAYASEAGMSLRDYEDFYYAACLATDADPLTAWQRQSDQVNHLAEWIEGKEEVRIQGPGTDITLGSSGRHWIPCVGEHNMPDGEFFTGPLEDSADGEVAFSFPASYGGRTCPACASASRTARSSTLRPTRARSS